MRQTAAEFDELLRSPRGFTYAASEYLTEVAYIVATEVLRPEDVNAVRAFENRAPELLSAGVVSVLEQWEAQSPSREGKSDEYSMYLMDRQPIVDAILADSAINTAPDVMAFLDPLIRELENEDDDDDDDVSSPLVPPLL